MTSYRDYDEHLTFQVDKLEFNLVKQIPEYFGN